MLALLLWVYLSIVVVWKCELYVVLVGSILTSEKHIHLVLIEHISIVNPIVCPFDIHKVVLPIDVID